MVFQLCHVLLRIELQYINNRNTNKHEILHVYILLLVNGGGRFDCDSLPTRHPKLRPCEVVPLGENGRGRQLCHVPLAIRYVISIS